MEISAPALGLNRLDVLPAWSDELADFVGADLDGFDPRGVWAHSAVGGDRRIHHVDDLHAGVAGAVDRFEENAHRQAGELEVELVTGDANRGATEFEVHVTEEVFVADDVEQALMLEHVAVVVELGHQTAGDSGYWALHRHTGVHEGHRPEQQTEAIEVEPLDSMISLTTRMA